MKKVIALFLFLFCLAPQTVNAARSISITSDKNSLFGDELMSVSASVSGFMGGEKIYLKGAFFKEGSTNYFGFIKNGDSWIKNSTTALDQKQVEIGSWDGNSIVKSDFNDSGYAGKGDYKFKLGFYFLTSGGNLSSINWSSNNIVISLDQPIPITTPSPTSIVKSSSSISTSKVATTKPTTISSQVSIVSKNTNNVVVAQKSNNFVKIAKPDEKTASNYAKIISTIEKPKIQKRQEVLGIKETNYLFYALPIGFILLFLAIGILTYKNIEHIKLWILK